MVLPAAAAAAARTAASNEALGPVTQGGRRIATQAVPRPGTSVPSSPQRVPVSSRRPREQDPRDAGTPRVLEQQEELRQRAQQQSGQTAEQRKQAQGKVHINNLTAFFMLAVAALIEGVQFALSFLHVLPVVGTALALVLTIYLGIVASWFIFPLWYALCGVSANRWFAILRFLAFLIPAVGECMPFINALPLITTSVVINIVLSRRADAKERKEQEEAQKRAE